MATQINLPQWFNADSTHNFVQKIAPGGAPIDSEIGFNFSELQFIDGIGLTIFCNSLEWLFTKDVKCKFFGFEKHSDPILYLDDCGFFRSYVGAPLREVACVRNTTLPLRRIVYAESHGWLDLQATPWLGSKLGVAESALGTIRACIKEIFNNVEDHSSKSIACVHMQHYPQKNEIQITISDFGQGIPTNIRKIDAAKSDAELIKKATEEGVTTKSHPNNRGAGLSTLIDCVTLNGGRVRISSLRGSLFCRRGQDSEVMKTVYDAPGSYPGTLVNVTLRTDLFVGDDSEEVDFQW